MLVTLVPCRQSGQAALPRRSLWRGTALANVARSVASAAPPCAGQARTARRPSSDPWQPASIAFGLSGQKAKCPARGLEGLLDSRNLVQTLAWLNGGWAGLWRVARRSSTYALHLSDARPRAA